MENARIQPFSLPYNYRRLRTGVISVYRIINKIDKLELSPPPHFNTRLSRHNSVRLMKPRALTADRQTVSWNELPEDDVLLDSLNQLGINCSFLKHKAFKYEITFKLIKY